MEYLKDNDFQLSYHLGKANIVPDVLSRKSNSVLAPIEARLWAMTVEIIAINPVEEVTTLLANLFIPNDLVDGMSLHKLVMRS